MKVHVTGPGRTAQIRRAGKAGRTTKANGEFASHLQTTTAAGATAVTTPTAVDGLFALQEVRDATDEAVLAKAFAEKLLDQLDALRHALLAGAISPAQLRELQDFVRMKRVKVADPWLADVLDEIELRASVELAKYQSSL
ncbi:MAG: flagellar assembly protein FliX [Alphaproteobacteria bacterium]|nr:flagellar assembly protein FliX [Alphaproteobacteria bacterium]